MKRRSSYHYRVISRIATSGFSCGPVLPDELVPRKQAVAVVASGLAQQRLEVVVEEAAQ